jgi:hypothetical protein
MESVSRGVIASGINISYQIMTQGSIGNVTTERENRLTAEAQRAQRKTIPHHKNLLHRKETKKSESLLTAEKKRFLITLSPQRHGGHRERRNSFTTKAQMTQRKAILCPKSKARSNLPQSTWRTQRITF